jgi:hypothetical protein
MPKRRSPGVMKLSLRHLTDIVEGIRDIVWLHFDRDHFFHNPDKEWDWDTLGYVAGTLEDAGLWPAGKDAE